MRALLVQKAHSPHIRAQRTFAAPSFHETCAGVPEILGQSLQESVLEQGRELVAARGAYFNLIKNQLELDS